MTDYIKRADAIEAVASTKPIVRSTERNWGKMIAEQHSKELVKALKALPSADRPTHDDLISRHEALMELNGACSTWQDDAKVAEIIHALPSADAKGANLIDRHDATTIIREECEKCNNLINADLLGRIIALPTPRQTDCTEFIEWLIEVVLDDEDWELNAVGYGEIIARKMAKLGLLEVLDGYYIRTPNKPQNVVAEIKIDADEIVSKAMSALSAEAEQITGKLKNPCDSLLKDDSAECKEQKSKLDLISRADAENEICEVIMQEFDVPPTRAYEVSEKILKLLPSAETEWIPFTRRPMTEEEQKDYPNCTFMFDCVLPDDGDEILVSNGRFVWMDTFCTDIDGCYLDGGDDIDEDMAWMPLPEPYKGGDDE